MALVRNQYCHECEQETMHTNGHCNTCFEREERERKAAWNGLTLDEKMQDLRRRIDLPQVSL